jgi:hypothetical protein
MVRDHGSRHDGADAAVDFEHEVRGTVGQPWA